MKKSLVWRANKEGHALRNLDWFPYSEIVLLTAGKGVGGFVPKLIKNWILPINLNDSEMVQAVVEVNDENEARIFI